VNLLNIENLPTGADFEVHGSLTKLLADTDHQLTHLLELARLNEHFQPIARLFVHVPVVADPGALKGSFKRVATKGITNLSEDFSTLISMNP